MSNTAQNWLDTKYKDKNSSGKIELYDWTTGNSEELTGELEIKDYVNIEEIRLTRRDKKGKIKKVVIENCPQVEKIKLDNNEITEIVFKGNFPKLERLDLSNNGLKEIDVSLTPNLNGLNLNSNPDLVEIRGLENLTKLKTLILLDTSGLNGKKFKEWKERPTKEELTKAVNDKADEFKGFIDPKNNEVLAAAARDQGMVPKSELEQANGKVKGYEEGLKTSLGLGPNDPLPSDWKDRLDKIKNELDDWKNTFGRDKKPADVKKELDSKPATGGSSGTGAVLPDNYTAMVAYLMKSEGSTTWKENLKEWEKKNNYYVEKAKQYLAQVEQKPK